jgi:hypothetical protein
MRELTTGGQATNKNNHGQKAGVEERALKGS